MRPIIRIGNTLLLPDGSARAISRVEQLLYKLGLKKTARL